jgi:anti-sigma factor RsiW
MLCSETQEKLEAYAGAELPERERRVVDKHLDSCEECRADLERLRRMGDVMRHKSTPPVPEELADRVMERAKGRRRSGPAGETKILRLDSLLQRSGPWRAAVAAAFLVGLGIGLLMALGSRPRPPAPGRQVARADPATYGLDYISGAPSDSLTGSFLRLTSNRNQTEP